MTKSLSIIGTFDLICPWCWIGKVNLERALTMLRTKYVDLDVCLEWRGVQLMPDVPQQGLPFSEFYERRLGSRSAVSARQKQVNQAAACTGLHISFEKIKVFPNTGIAHALLTYANQLSERTVYETLLDRLFKAYFELGEDIGSSEYLFRLAESAGIERTALESWLSKPDLVKSSERLNLNANGVPNFIFDKKIEISGAQSPDTLFVLMRSILDE